MPCGHARRERQREREVGGDRERGSRREGVEGERRERGSERKNETEKVRIHKC